MSIRNRGSRRSLILTDRDDAAWSSLFSDGGGTPGTFHEGSKPPGPFHDHERYDENETNDGSKTTTEPPADVVKYETGTQRPIRNSDDDRDVASPSSARRRHEEWAKEDVIMVTVLPVVLAALLCLSFRHCLVANRRHARFHEIRQGLRAAQRAEAREAKRIGEKRRKERAREIERALVTKTASKCECSSSIREFAFMSDLTLRTNVTDDMSASSSCHGVENPPAQYDDDDDASSSQNCAICLEPYVGGKDKVSWSRYQTCRHAFHRKCIEGWLAKEDRAGNCPCCRGPYLREAGSAAKNVVGAAGGTPSNGGDDESNDGVGENLGAVGGTSPSGDSRAPDEERDAGGEGSDDTNETPDAEHRNGDEERRVGEYGPSDASARTPRADEESPAEEDGSGDASARTTGRRGAAGGGAAGSALAEGAPAIDAKTRTTASEFASFCVVHGLMRDREGDDAILLVEPVDNTTGSENNV